MKKVIMSVIFIVFLCCGCNNASNETRSSITPTEEKNAVETISDTIKWNDIHKMNNDDRIIQNADHIFVYDITDYADENFEYQYQYFIYNDEGTVLIDKGIQGVNGYVFDKIADKIIRGKRSLGSNVWESVYYNQKTGKKSKKIQTPVIEISEYVGYIVVEKGISYLKLENMFNDKESYSYKLGKDDYIPGVRSVKYKDGIIRVKNGQKEINIEVGNIF